MKELPALLEAFKSIDLPAQEIEYRLYYDETGRPTTMSSSDFPLGGRYILIDRDTYDKADYDSLKVQDGILTKVENSLLHYFSLAKSQQGFRTAKGHASILVNETYQGETEYYGLKNH